MELSRFSNFLKGKDIPLADLTPLIEKDRDKFVEARLALYSKNGKLYGLDTHVGTTVMFYNMDIMKKRALIPPPLRHGKITGGQGKKCVRPLGNRWERLKQTTPPHSYP